MVCFVVFHVLIYSDGGKCLLASPAKAQRAIARMDRDRKMKANMAGKLVYAKSGETTVKLDFFPIIGR